MRTRLGLQVGGSSRGNDASSATILLSLHLPSFTFLTLLLLLLVSSSILFCSSSSSSCGLSFLVIRFLLTPLLAMAAELSHFAWRSVVGYFWP